MNIKLETPKREDYQKVDKLLLKLHNKHSSDYPAFYNELDNFNSQEEYNEFIRQENRVIMLAKQSEKVVGLLWAEIKEKRENRYMKTRKELWLEGIVVDDCYRNLGIGKLLMEELIHIGEKGDFDSIELMVWDRNNEAINLYKRYFEKRAIIMTYPLKLF